MEPRPEEDVLDERLGGKMALYVVNPGTGDETRGHGADSAMSVRDEGVEKGSQLRDAEPVDPVVIPKEQELSSPICQDVEAQKMA